MIWTGTQGKNRLGKIPEHLVLSPRVMKLVKRKVETQFALHLIFLFVWFVHALQCHSTSLIQCLCLFYANTQRSFFTTNWGLVYTAKRFKFDKMVDTRTLYSIPKLHSRTVFNVWQNTTKRFDKHYPTLTWTTRRDLFNSLIVASLKAMQTWDSLLLYYFSSSSHERLKMSSRKWSFVKAPIPMYR